MIKTTEKIFRFLELNGFKKEDDRNFIHFYRENDYGIDFDKINLDFTFIAEEGDIFTIPKTKNPTIIKCIIVGFFTLFPAIESKQKTWINE
jgi:hypothetical protein